MNFIWCIKSLKLIDAAFKSNNLTVTNLSVNTISINLCKSEQNEPLAPLDVFQFEFIIKFSELYFGDI